MAAPPQAGKWVLVILATSSLLYHLAWPLLNTHSPCLPPSALYSLTTKFLFVFTSLNCFAFLIPFTWHVPKTANLTPPAATNQFMSYTAALPCMAVNALNYLRGRELAVTWLQWYLARGAAPQDPSRFNRRALFLGTWLVTALTLAAVGFQAKAVLVSWWRAKEVWVSVGGEEDVSGAVEERDAKEPITVVVEKA